MTEFTDKEKWICILTIFKTSQFTKLIPKQARQTLEDMLRKKFCQQIDYEQWRDIEYQIIKLSKTVQSYYFEMALKSIGKVQLDQVELDQVKNIQVQIGNEHITTYLNMIKSFLQTSEHPKNDKIIQL